MGSPEERGGTPMSRRERVYLALIFVVVALIVCVLLLRPRNTAPAASDAGAADNAPQETVREVEKLITVEKQVEAETIESGLREMGVLVTGEYYFKDLVSFSKVKTFLKTDFTLPFTETSYLVSYEGTVSAGIDLSAARVEKDGEHLRVTVFVPPAAIQATDIDLDSFTLYEEKSGLGNPLSVQDVNQSLQELERDAEQKAMDSGLLEKADRSAALLLRQFVGAMLSDPAYTLVIEVE
ncbi:MAG: DUF4230 domain-containing protein [Oscillospiraceae bacterium]|nr:DUF4230 domain-containing protein [Oscillospiraceae bacterium]